MGIKTVAYSPQSSDLAPCDFWLFPELKNNLRVSRFEDIENMKEAVAKVWDMFNSMGPSQRGWNATTSALNSEVPALKEISVFYFFEINKSRS